jgi:hypothetical protein
MKKIIAITAVLAVSGCSVPTAADYMAATDLQVCQAYAMARAGFMPNVMIDAETELRRRKAITPEELQLVMDQRIKVGTREHIAVCAWGPYVDVNSTTGSWGTSKQYVMGQLGPYVYVRGGKVTAFQQ